MKKNDIVLKLTCFLSIIFFSLNTFAGDLKTGSSAVKITPPPGAPLAGYYYDRGADGVHDDLFAKAIVFEKDGNKAVVISCDLICVPEEIVSAARALIKKGTGISTDHIMISATHSHTGPVMPENIDLYKNLQNEAYIRYLSELPGLIAESAVLANASLSDAKLMIGQGHEESISFNRRFFMTDGTVGWNPGKLNPKIIKPAGPIDPEVLVLYAENSEGKPLTTYVNFAVHLDNVGGTEISADMPYTLSTILGKIKGEDMVTLFGQGCAGNINHINVKTKESQSGHGEAQRIGTVLSGEVLKIYSRLKPLNIGNISAKREIVELKLPDVTIDELPEAKEIISGTGKSGKPTFLEIVNAYKVVEVLERKGKPVEAEIQVIALGEECAIVSLPGEIFTEIGMYIKSRSPYPYTLVVELANGSIGYVPDSKAYIEGNYEPVSSIVAQGSGEVLAERALSLLNDLKSGR